MKLFLRLCTITCKKAWKSFPLLFAGAVVLLGLISTIAFCCMKLSGKEQSFAQVTIGVAFLDTPTDSSALADNTYFHTLLSFIGDMQSTRDYFDFTLMDKSDAHAQLASGDIAALLLIPSDVLSSILDGSNHSIQVIFPHTSDFSSTILQELTRSGAHMLGTAQSGIYTIHDLYLRAGLEDYLQNSYDRINQLNLRNVLTRNDLFHSIGVSATGTLSTIDFYMLSAFLLLLFTWGITFSLFLQKNTPAFVQKLLSCGGSCELYVLAQLFTLFTCYLGFELLLVLLCSILQQLPMLLWSMLPALLITSLFLSVFTLFCYTITSTTVGGILFHFSCSLCLLLLSGCIIPLAFFPSFCRLLAPWLAPRQLLLLLYASLTGSVSSYQGLGQNLLLLFGEILLLFTVTLLTAHNRKELHT